LSTLRIGASSRLLWNLPLENGIEALAKIGYECIEIWAEPPHLVPSSFPGEGRHRLRNLLHELNLEATLHATSWDLNIASLNPTIREVSIDLVEESIDLAADIEVDLVVVHPGKMSSSKGTCTETNSILVEALRELAERAREKGVILALENMEKRPKEIIVTPDDLKGLLAAVRSNSLVGLVDVAHANLVLDPTKFLVECLDVLAHVHISDNKGSAPIHLPLGKGTIDLGKIFEVLNKGGYKGRVIIEGFVSEDPMGTAKDDFEFAAALIHRLNQSYLPLS